MSAEFRDPTINGFCARHRISRAFFYVLAGRGEAPATYAVGKLVRISAEAESAWIRQREAAQVERAAVTA